MKISACILLVVGLALVHPQLSAACRCNSDLVEQVCGADGVTYQNSCYLFCKNLALRDKEKPEIATRCDKPCDQCP